MIKKILRIVVSINHSILYFYKYLIEIQSIKNIMNWSEHGDRWKNSILQLNVIRAIYNSERPYCDPSDERVFGSAFIIDIERGYVGTNAHVVSNAISISGRINKLGKKDISLELIGICAEKDLALCKINHDDIKLLTRGMKKEEILALNMKFGDNMELKETDEVMIIGYPLGQDNIKYTTGIISGFESKNNNDGDIEDAKSRYPIYIQITASINKGNTGGPVLNKKGEVVGIVSYGVSEPLELNDDKVGYAIPTRTFLSIYFDLVKTNVVKMPTLALEWNKSNRELMKSKTDDEKNYGIYVRNIYPDSCVDSLEHGDIIKRLDYEDPFWASKDAFNVCNHDQNNIKSIILCYFDRYGDATVGLKDERGFLKLIERKLSFSEIMDMVPIGSQLNLEICRDKEWYMLQAKHSFKNSNRIVRLFPRIEPIDYEIFAGICCANLDIIHIDTFDKLRYYKENNKENRYGKKVVICQVFPDTSASQTQVLRQGHLIDKLNGTKIESIEDIRKILRNRPAEIRIETTDRSYFMVLTDTVVSEDKKAMKNFNIRNHNYLLESKQIQ